MRLTGFDAIEYAEQHNVPLNQCLCHADEDEGISIAEAEAIAMEDPELIWCEVPAPDAMRPPLAETNPAAIDATS